MRILLIIASLLIGITIGASVRQVTVANTTGAPIQGWVRCFYDHEKIEQVFVENGATRSVIMACPDSLKQFGEKE